MKTNSNCHSGHRKRLLETVNNIGIENMSELQTLEFLLSLIQPRVDTNPTAHALLDEFGNFANVLDADEKFLANINGVGDRTAKLISSFKGFFYAYNKSKLKSMKRILNRQDTYDLAHALYFHCDKEVFYICATDKNSKIITIKEMSSSDSNQLSVPVFKLSEFVVKHKAQKLLFYHNHPNGDCTPSKADCETTERFMNYCRTFGIDFIDHIIVGNNQLYSFLDNRKIDRSEENHDEN